jgi:plasmid stabilization system protein ParE
MAARLILTLEVKHDIADAYLWYQSQRSGLGEEFVRCVEDCLDTIQRRPRLSAPVYEDYRRAFVRRFPYCVVYEFEKATVTVYSVIHTARDPDKWHARLP